MRKSDVNGVVVLILGVYVVSGGNVRGGDLT